MSTDSGAAEQSNETRFFNLTTTEILNIAKFISICITIFSTIVQYITIKSASSFYGIDSELFYSQLFWLTIIDFLIPALVNLAILLTPSIVADYYRNSLKPIKEDSNSKGKTHALLNIPLVLLIFCYTLLSGGYILRQCATLFDSLKKECVLLLLLIIILAIILPFIIILLIEIYTAINKAQQAGKDKNWYLASKCVLLMPPAFFILSNIAIVILILFYPIKIYILLPLILCDFFMLYYLVTLYFFIDENEFFFITYIVFTVLCYIPFIYTVLIPLSSGKTYYPGKKQYEIVEPISGSNIASGSNLKVVILHKDNQLLLMDFTTDENTKDRSATSKENETQAKQSIEEILSKASESNLNIKKWEYTIQDENLYKFYTVTFNKVNCE